MTAMLMRHTESSARLSLGHSREIVDQYQTLLGQEHTHHTRLLEQAYARIRVLEARETEALELREKLQSHAIERDCQLDALKRKDEMRKFAIEKLGPVIPILMAKLLGAGPASENVPGTWAAGVVAARVPLPASAAGAPSPGTRVPASATAAAGPAAPWRAASGAPAPVSPGSNSRPCNRRMPMARK